MVRDMSLNHRENPPDHMEIDLRQTGVRKVKMKCFRQLCAKRTDRHMNIVTL